MTQHLTCLLVSDHLTWCVSKIIKEKVDVIKINILHKYIFNNKHKYIISTVCFSWRIWNVLCKILAVNCWAWLESPWQEAFPENSTPHPYLWSFPGGSDGKEPSCNCKRVQALDREDPLEKEIATHSSILAWRIPWTEEPGGLQSMGLQRVSDTTDWLSTHYLFLCCKAIIDQVVIGIHFERPGLHSSLSRFWMSQWFRAV